jgi:hypothetical protein
MKLTAPAELKELALEAAAHVAEDVSMARDMAKVPVTLQDLGPRLRGRLGAGGLLIDTATARAEGAGRMAATIRHELEHLRLTRQKVSSAQQEPIVRARTAMWAGMKYGSMAKTNPRAAGGFLSAAKEQRG